MASSGVHPLVASVRDFVERQVRPAATELEHTDRYPHQLVARMRELGLFGAVIPTAWGGLGLDVTTYARLVEELCRGWMSLAGVINSHTMAALIVLHHGTEAQRERFLPGLARGVITSPGPAPRLGADTEAILRDVLGYAPEQIGALRASGALGGNDLTDPSQIPPVPGRS